MKNEDVELKLLKSELGVHEIPPLPPRSSLRKDPNIPCWLIDNGYLTLEAAIGKVAYAKLSDGLISEFYAASPLVLAKQSDNTQLLARYTAEIDDYDRRIRDEQDGKVRGTLMLLKKMTIDSRDILLHREKKSGYTSTSADLDYCKRHNVPPPQSSGQARLRFQRLGLKVVK